MKTQRELLLVAIAGLLNGCVSSLEGAPCPCAAEFCCWNKVCRPEKDCHVDIAFVPKAADNPVFAVALKAATQAAEDLNNVVGGPTVNVRCVSPQALSANNQASLVSGIKSQASGLIVSCLDPKVLTGAIDAKVQAGIQVITYDSDCPNSHRIGFYGMKNARAGAEAADRLVLAMSEEGFGPKEVAIVTGAPAENLNARVQGFQEQLEKYPFVHIASINECDLETPDQCRDAIERLFGVPPKLDGLFIAGLWGLQSACECSGKGNAECSCDNLNLMPNWKKNAAKPGTLKTVTFDALPFQRELLKQKYVSALIGQNYVGWGRDTVNLMVQHITQGREVGDVNSGFGVYTQNGDPESPNWEAGDFTSDLSACAAAE